MRRLAALALSLSLPACVAGEAAMQESARGLARTAVDAAAARYLPGVSVKPFTDCVIDNATTSELIQLANAAARGTEAATAAYPVVKMIARRPETARCLVSSVPGLQLEVQ